MFTEDLVIPINTATSNKIELDADYTIVGLLVPPMTQTALDIYVSSELTGTYRLLNKIDGSGQWQLTTNATGMAVVLGEGAGSPWSCLYVKTPGGNEGTERTIKVCAKK